MGWLGAWVGVAAFARVRGVRLTSDATPPRMGLADNEPRRYVFTPAPEAATRNRPQAQYFSRTHLGSEPAIQPRLEDGDFAPVMPSGKVGRRADAVPWGLVEERLEDEAETGFVGEELGMS